MLIISYSKYLEKDLQLKDLLEGEYLKIESFRREAKMGWIELDISDTKIHEASYWVEQGYEHSLNISKPT